MHRGDPAPVPGAALRAAGAGLKTGVPCLYSSPTRPFTDAISLSES